MQKFFLNEKIKIEALSRSANTALQKYNHKEYDTENMLTGLLTDCIGFYKNGGNTSREMEFLSLQAELNTAHRGINPRTLERVSIRRNEMKEIIMFKVLQSVSEIIRAELDGVTTVLNDTKILISQILLAAIQGGLLDDLKIKGIKKQDDIEKMWNEFSVDANLSLAQKKVHLQISRPDILILCDELLSQLRR